MKYQITFYLIPHTHWDREWYLPFQEFRMRLVHLSRILIEYMEKNPNYFFTFDGQSIVIDDIAEIERGTSEKLIKFAQNGRIKFGPWFVQPDEFLVSGESLTRNLLIGIKKASSVSNGNFLHVGYAPDLFGHIPQLGEIFNQFNITHLIFWRGVPMKIENSEFYWITPSGRKVLVTSLFQSYSNGLNLPSEIDLLQNELKSIANSIEGKISTLNYLLMNGTDHELPQIPLGDLFINSKLIKYPNFKIKIAALDEYSKEVRSLLIKPESSKELIEISGELRNTYRAPILSGVLSARLYLKKENAYLERLLEDYLFPLNSVMNLITGDDHSENINYLSEKLIVNHSHDCICGCSVDTVHEEMEYRYKSIKQMGHEVLETIKGILASKLSDQENFQDNKNSQIAVINPHSFKFEGLISTQFEPNFTTNSEEKVTYEPLKTGFYEILDIFDKSTTQVNFEQEKETIIKDYAIGTYHINRLEETIKNMPKTGWHPVNYHVRKIKGKSEFIFEFSRRKTKRRITMEEIKILFKDLVLDKNEFIRVIFKSIPFMNGKLAINNIKPYSIKLFTLSFYQQDEIIEAIKELNINYNSFTIFQSKENFISLTINILNKTFFVDNLIQFEDLGDRGDEYNFCPLDSDEPIMPFFDKWTILEQNSMYLKVKFDYNYILPKEITLNRNKRSKETENCPLNVIVTLYSNHTTEEKTDYPRIDFTITFQNNVKDHRLRVKLKIPFDSETYFTSSPYYVVKRDSKFIVKKKLLEESIEKPSKTVPQKEFTTIKDEEGNIGCTIINNGLPEVEYDFISSEIKLTLLRAVGWLSRSDLSTRNGHAGPELTTPGAQCIGETICNFSVLYHPKDIEWSEIYRKTKNILSSPVSIQLKQELVNDNNSSFLEIMSESFIVTSFERIGDGFLVRGVNYSEKSDEIEINTKFDAEFYKITNLVDLTSNNLEKYPVEQKIKDNLLPWELKNYYFKKK